MKLKKEQPLLEGSPWPGLAEIRIQGNSLVPAFDSDLDEGRLDGEVDAVLMATIRESGVDGLPGRIEDATVIFNRKEGSLKVAKSGNTLLEVVTDAELHQPNLEKSNKPAIHASALFYSLQEQEEDLASATGRLLEQKDELVSEVPAVECRGGGRGAWAWACACSDNLQCGVICSQGFYACCQCESGRICHCVTEAESR